MADFKWHDEQRHVEESKYGCGVGLVMIREALLMLRLIAGLRMPGPLEEEEEGWPTAFMSRGLCVVSGSGSGKWRESTSRGGKIKPTREVRRME